MKTFLFPLLALTLLISCGTSSSTSVQNSWTNSSSTENLNTMKKVVVIAMSDDISQRKAIEDAFCSQLGAKAIPSYSYYNVSLTKISQSEAESKLSAAGFDGAVVVRLTAHHESGSKRPPSVSVEPSLYMNFHGNIGGGIGVGINPGHNTLKDQYEIDTSVYNIPAGQLLWSADLNATNPGNINDLANQMASKIVSKMKSDGFYN